MAVPRCTRWPSPGCWTCSLPPAPCWRRRAAPWPYGPPTAISRSPGDPPGYGIGSEQAADRAVQQVDVQAGDDHRDQEQQCAGWPAAGHVAHQLAVAGDEQQREEREGDAEGQDDLG